MKLLPVILAVGLLVVCVAGSSAQQAELRSVETKEQFLDSDCWWVVALV